MPFSGTCTLYLTLQTKPGCHFWPGAEVGRRGALSSREVLSRFLPVAVTVSTALVVEHWERH